MPTNNLERGVAKLPRNIGSVIRAQLRYFGDAFAMLIFPVGDADIVAMLDAKPKVLLMQSASVASPPLPY